MVVGPKIAIAKILAGSTDTNKNQACSTVFSQFFIYFEMPFWQCL